MGTLKIILLGAVAIPCVLASQEAPERKFASGYAGSLPDDPSLLAKTYFNTPSIRRLIFDMEDGPVSLGRVEKSLENTGFQIEELLRVRLLRREGEEYYIDFNFFPQKDMQLIHELGREKVPALVHAYLTNQARFNEIFEKYPVETVSKDRLAFSLIAGFSLNWDGLKVTRKEGFREPNSVEGTGWEYSFWASEEDPDFDTREMYWGSSTAPYKNINFEEDPVDYAFSSFGDPYSSPRMNFPDLFYLPLEDLEEGVRRRVERLGLRTETAMGFEFENVLGMSRMRDVSTILFALRHGEKTARDLGGGLREPEELEPLLALLEEIQYIRANDDGTYSLLIPVFDAQDREMVGEVIELSRLILTDWLLNHYPDIRGRLTSLTSLKHGVPFEALFTQIWHDFFGLTTRELARSGFLADPYGDEARHKGSLGCLWRFSMYEIEIG